MPKVRLAFITLMLFIATASLQQSTNVDQFADVFLVTTLDVMSKLMIGIMISRT